MNYFKMHSVLFVSLDQLNLPLIIITHGENSYFLTVDRGPQGQLNYLCSYLRSCTVPPPVVGGRPAGGDIFKAELLKYMQ